MNLLIDGSEKTRRERAKRENIAQRHKGAGEIKKKGEKMKGNKKNKIKKYFWNARMVPGRHVIFLERDESLFGKLRSALLTPECRQRIQLATVEI